ncbi:DAZ-associated protein 1 [Taenia crassiceps]|uniref:DAZ-associated protein 1 n=1 Tax=Taenia crassiceps TaxID=6207 RepID=A0ABR4QBM4_9CEST
MQTPPKGEQSDDLICGVCKKLLHIPYTLPCRHSYCLEPCLIARPSQTDVRCFCCDKVYPRKLAVHNEILERLVTQRFVEERRSLVTTCNACQHPAPVLHACQHCQLCVCSSCWDSHCAKVVASVTESMRLLLNKKKKLEETRNLLKATPSAEGSRLKDGIKGATLELKDACDKSLDLSMANLIAFFTGYLDDLVAVKEAAIKTLGGLLDLKEELRCTGVRAECIHKKVDKCKERPTLRICHLLTGTLETLSLIIVIHQGDDDNAQSGCQDEVSEVGSTITSASTGKKIFVGGVPQRMDHTQLRKYFSRYGPVKNAFVSRHKGYGCVTFESEESALKATSERIQLIDGRRVEVKEYIKHGGAALKTEPSKSTTPSPQLWEQEKVYISGISTNMTKASLQFALSQLGPIKKLDMVPQRGFGVVVFTDSQTTESAIAKHWLNVDSKRVELLPFVPAKEARGALARSSIKPSLPTETTNMPSLKSSSSPSLAPPTHPTPAPPPEAQKRVFVGGISRVTTEASLSSALSKLGPVQQVDIFPTRSYAVVVFKRPETFNVAISVHWYMVDDKMVELQPFTPNNKSEKAKGQRNLSRIALASSIADTSGPAADQPLQDISSRTLYVDGIGESINESELELYFSQYGDVKQCQITGKLGRLVFESSENLQNALRTQPHDLNGKRLVLIPASSEKHKIGDSGGAHAGAVSSMINARKLLIRGVGEGTTYTVLRNYFLNYGPVDYASVADTEAWVVFKNAKTVNLVLATQPHFIRGRQITLFKPSEGDASSLCPSTPSPVGIGDVSTVVSAPLLGPLFNPNERSSPPRRVASSNALSGTKSKGSGSVPRNNL